MPCGAMRLRWERRGGPRFRGAHASRPLVRTYPLLSRVIGLGLIYILACNAVIVAWAGSLHASSRFASDVGAVLCRTAIPSAAAANPADADPATGDPLSIPLDPFHVLCLATAACMGGACGADTAAASTGHVFQPPRAARQLTHLFYAEPDIRDHRAVGPRQARAPPAHA